MGEGGPVTEFIASFASFSMPKITKQARNIKKTDSRTYERKKEVQREKVVERKKEVPMEDVLKPIGRDSPVVPYEDLHYDESEGGDLLETTKQKLKVSKGKSEKLENLYHSLLNDYVQMTKSMEGKNEEILKVKTENLEFKYQVRELESQIKKYQKKLHKLQSPDNK